MNIISLINDLKKEDVNNFIDERLSVLNNKEEKEIGFNTDITRFDGFLGFTQKVNVTCEYLLVDGVMETYNGSIIFDDKEMFKVLINEVKNNTCLYDAINSAVNKYLSLNDISRRNNSFEKTRSMLYHQYSASMNKPLSIKLFHNNKSASCAEVAGVTQNMLSFLDIESDYVILGEENNSFHAFNIVYPNGRDSVALIYDFSNISDNRPLICIIDEDKKNKLLSNEKIIVTEEEIAKTFGKDIKWKQKETEYLIFKSGNPKEIAEYKKPFTIERKLVYKNN